MTICWHWWMLNWGSPLLPQSWWTASEDRQKWWTWSASLGSTFTRWLPCIRSPYKSRNIRKVGKEIIWLNFRLVNFRDSIQKWLPLFGTTHIAKESTANENLAHASSFWAVATWFYGVCSNGVVNWPGLSMSRIQCLDQQIMHPWQTSLFTYSW